jgi:hypothetical protein
MSWHVDAATMDRYQAGAVDRVTGASVEAHVTGCADCRQLVEADPARLQRWWEGTAVAVMPGRPGMVERGLARLGVPGHLARLVAVSPVMRASFLLATAIVTAFAALASASDPDGRTYMVFVAVAPLVPVAGVGFAYGRLVDPAHELTMSSPIDALRLLLIRAATVLAVSLVAGLVAWPFVPVPSTLGLSAWLAPALALTLVTLALASRLPVGTAAAVVAAAWVLLMASSAVADLDVFVPAGQAAWAALATLAAAAVAVRRHHYGREGRAP